MLILTCGLTRCYTGMTGAKQQLNKKVASCHRGSQYHTGKETAAFGHHRHKA